MMKKITLILFLTAFSYAGAFAQGDTCADAIDISAIFGGGLGNTLSTDLFDNTSATAGADDPADGMECFFDGPAAGPNGPSLENTMWFTFVGDGNSYLIDTGDCLDTAANPNLDTQMSVYSGDCGTLVAEFCNEDGGPNLDGINNLFPAGGVVDTEAGTPYYVFIDGWNGSVGEFCISGTEVDQTCAGILPSSSITTSPVCFNDTLSAVLTVLPNIPVTNNEDGFVWIITSELPTGEADPQLDPSFEGAFPVDTQPYNLLFINTTIDIPAGDYFFTAVTFGNVPSDPMNGALLFGDPGACIAYDEPLPITLLDQLPPLEIEPVIDEANMEINLVVSGGTDEYVYLWEADGSEESSFTYPAPDVYSVMVADATFCLPVETLEISTVGSGIADLSTANVSVFPNPVKDFVNINWTASEIAFESFRVVNLLGQSMRSGNVGDSQQTMQLDVADFSVGQYFLILESTEGELLQTRFFVER